jgi:hypothetical protein
VYEQCDVKGTMSKVFRMRNIQFVMAIGIFKGCCSIVADIRNSNKRTDSN